MNAWSSTIGVAFAALASVVLTGEAARAAPNVPFMKKSAPCGSRSDLHFCLAVTPDDEIAKRLPKFRVSYPGAGMAMVTWSGTVFCQVEGRSDRR